MASRLLPLIILAIVLGIACVIGYVVYSIANDIAQKTQERMEKHNVKFGKEGLKIGMKEVAQEDYVGQTQSVLVKAWNLSTWPAYKSRLWNQQKPANAQTSGARPHKA